MAAAHPERVGRRAEGVPEMAQADEEKDQNLSNVSRDKWAEILEKMVPEDFKYKM